MLKLRFFSLIREALDCEELEVEHSSDVLTLDALKLELISRGGDAWREALLQPNVVHAVNQRVVDPSHKIQDGDEIAFFPPMTGG